MYLLKLASKLSAINWKWLFNSNGNIYELVYMKHALARRTKRTERTSGNSRRETLTEREFCSNMPMENENNQIEFFYPSQG